MKVTKAIKPLPFAQVSMKKNEDNIGFIKAIFRMYCKMYPNDQELGKKIRNLFR